MKYSSYSVRQLPNKTWQARLRYKKDNKWKETSKILRTANGKKEAKKLALEWFNSMNEVAETQPSTNKTIRETMEEYLDYQLSTGIIEQSTYKIQKQKLSHNIAPDIGDFDFKTFDRNAIIAWQTKLFSKGYKPSTVNYLMKLVSKVYNYAYQIGEIDRNPFTTVKIQRGKPRTTHLTNSQAEQFLTALYLDYDPSDWMYAVCLLAYYGGLRRGEIAGLRYRNINFETNTISIDTAIGVKDDGSYAKNPKTPSSIRKFPMTKQLAEGLRQRYEMLQPDPNEFVASSKGTQHLHPLTLGVNFKKFVDRNNLKDVYGRPLILHALRHQLGYVGVKSGMDVASLSHMMGHSSKAMTLDTYSESDTDAMLLASKKLEKAFSENGDLDT